MMKDMEEIERDEDRRGLMMIDEEIDVPKQLIPNLSQPIIQHLDIYFPSA